MKTLTKSLPLTQEDIFILRRKPVAKKINPNHIKNSLAIEEWIYYNVNTMEQECFSFKSGTLINWMKKPI